MGGDTTLMVVEVLLKQILVNPDSVGFGKVLSGLSFPINL